MDLSLNKLPWYAQVGLFVALAVAGVAAFYYLYAVPADQALEAQRKKLAALRVDISQGMTIAQQLPQFRAQVADLETRMAVLAQELAGMDPTDWKAFNEKLESQKGLETELAYAMAEWEEAQTALEQAQG